MPRNALGRGLSALIREPEPQQPLQQPVPGATSQEAASATAQVPSAQIRTATTGAAAAPARLPADSLIEVDIDLIDPSPYQPRTRFREEALEELAQSIRSSGIVQPLVVRRIGLRYQLIAGERRWRAAQRTARPRVPVIVREVPEELAVEMTLIENLQREDLNPIEQARAFQRLGDDFQLTQEQLAERTGKDRATIANLLRLLRLDQPIQELLEEGRLTAGHARALLAIADAKARLELARRIARTGMTVRQVERLAARGSKTPTTAAAQPIDPNTKAALEELQRKFGARVILYRQRPGHPGQLAFEYYDTADLTRIYDQLMRQ
jgi:ParB family transcriptional regulator, chromosome partitioning protein